MLMFQCSAQERKVGGGCEGCEGLLEYGQKILTPVDTLPTFLTHNPKLKITGTVFQKDGKTPAKDVVLYIYHTHRNGLYVPKANVKGWGKRHGFIRGWIKTNKYGQYTFYTVRPTAYPDRSEPEHIHLTVKEPGTIPYYLDDFVFDDDPLLNSAYKRKAKNRGGSGIMKPKQDGNLILIHRNLVLGLNIPDYE